MPPLVAEELIVTAGLRYHAAVLQGAPKNAIGHGASARKRLVLEQPEMLTEFD